MSAVIKDVESMKSKLPLWNVMRTEDNAKYYLKLEKFIK